MIDGILCTTDFSDSSKEALKWSIRLAKMMQCRLTILYAYRLYKQNGEGVAMRNNIETQARKNFGELENELLIGSGISYEFKTEVGFIADRIEDHAKKNKISFLVMGKSMSTKNKETFDEVVEHAQVPLVIVP